MSSMKNIDKSRLETDKVSLSERPQYSAANLVEVSHVDFPDVVLYLSLQERPVGMCLSWALEQEIARASGITRKEYTNIANTVFVPGDMLRNMNFSKYPSNARLVKFYDDWFAFYQKYYDEIIKAIGAYKSNLEDVYADYEELKKLSSEHSHEYNTIDNDGLPRKGIHNRLGGYEVSPAADRGDGEADITLSINEYTLTPEQKRRVFLLLDQLESERLAGQQDL